MKKAYRHGEIALIKIDELPYGLRSCDSKVLMQGNNGNSHSISQGDLFFKNVDTYVFGYLVANETNLQHLEHGNICSVCGFNKLVGTVNICPECGTDFIKEKKYRLAKVENGNFQLRKQQEFINNELQPIID